MQEKRGLVQKIALKVAGAVALIFCIISFILIFFPSEEEAAFLSSLSTLFLVLDIIIVIFSAVVALCASNIIQTKLSPTFKRRFCWVLVVIFCFFVFTDILGLIMHGMSVRGVLLIPFYTIGAIVYARLAKGEIPDTTF